MMCIKVGQKEKAGRRSSKTGKQLVACIFPLDPRHPEAATRNWQSEKLINEINF